MTEKDTQSPLREFMDSRLSDLHIHYVRKCLKQAAGLVVLMPAALSPNREDRKKKFFTRAKWADSWPEHEVLCFSDPINRLGA